MNAAVWVRVVSFSTWTVALAGAGCVVAEGELPGFGQACTVAEGSCPLDHRCLADEGARAVCIPVVDMGVCPDPTFPPTTGTVVAVDTVVQARDGLDELARVRRVSGKLRVARDDNGGGDVVILGDLCPLAGLQRVDAGVVLSEMDVTSLDGLQSLTSVGGAIAIIDNAQLTSVTSLAALLQVGTQDVGGADAQIFIASNPRLTGDAIEELRALLPDVEIRSCGNRLDGPCGNAELAALGVLANDR